MKTQALILSTLTGVLLFSTSPALKAEGPSEAGTPVKEATEDSLLMTPEARGEGPGMDPTLMKSEERRASLEEHRKRMQERGGEKAMEMPGGQGMGPQGDKDCCER